MKKENKIKVFSDKKKKFKTKIQEESDENDLKLILSDPRFAHIPSDPRYRNISSKATKIQIDERFKDVLTKEGFNFKHDPRGRPRSFGTKEGLDKFYNLKSSEDEADDESDDDESETSDDEEESDVDSSNIQLEKKSKPIDDKEKERNFLNSLMEPERDLARGDTVYSDDSSDDDSSTTDEEEEYEKEFDDFEWGELDADAKWDTEGNEVEETNRFAVCNMDWDHVKAVDLFVLFSSFAPGGGFLKKLTIYPSKYGKERMAEEEVSGPQELKKLSSLNKSGRSNDSFSNLDKIKKGILDEDDQASSLEFEALRRYQRNRLKYYYAVVECDSLETAKAIYAECDRSHFENGGVAVDLRYIPSAMEFDETPHDICEKTPSSYETEKLPAASISNVKPVLTWDETDPRRTNALRKAMTKISKKDKFDYNILNEFVAGSESDDDEKKSSKEEDKESRNDEEGNDTVEVKSKGKGKGKLGRIAKFRSLISEIEEKEKEKRESTFTFEEEEEFAAFHEVDSGEENKERDDDEDENSKEESNEDEIKNLTPFEKMLVKGEKRKKERKLKKKKKLQSIEESDSENDLDDSENSRIVNKSQKKTYRKKKNKNKSKESEDVPEKSNDDLALLVMDEEQEDKKHFDMRKIREKKEKMQKKKRKRNNENDDDVEQKIATNFEVNTADSRFSALFTNSEFSIDPSHPNFDKHSSSMQNIMQKQKKMKSNSGFVITNKSNNRNKSNNEHNSKIDSDISAMLKNYRVKTSK